MLKNKSWPQNDIVHPSQYEESTNWPKISIVTPSYNQGQFIEDTILSVLNQNYPNLEYIIIDGGSNDQTLDIIRKYENRISYWTSEPDRGQSDAINKGFKISSGEIGNWLNSDDILEKKALFHIAKEFSNTNHDFIIGEAAHWDANLLIKHAHTTSPENFKDLMRYNQLICIAQPSAFYKISIAKKLGVKETLHYTMDLDLWLRIGILIGIESKIKHINQPISLMRIQPDQKTSLHNWAAMKEAQTVILNYAEPYGYTFGEKVKLRLKYRMMRFNNAVNYKSKTYLMLNFPDIIFIKIINKLGWGSL